MLQTASQLLPELPLFLITAVATHLVMSFAQTLMHYKLGHHPIGGKFFRNHINFHHRYYSKDHLLSRTYLDDEGNNRRIWYEPPRGTWTVPHLIAPTELAGSILHSLPSAVFIASSDACHGHFGKCLTS
jgi:hypothetical protein